MNTNAASAPAVRLPDATSLTASHRISVTAPNSSAITIAVITARVAKRSRAVEKPRSTAAWKRSPSRASCPKAWTIFIAPSVSLAMLPISAIRSWLAREYLRSRAPSIIIGVTISGMPSSRNAASLGASTNR